MKSLPADIDLTVDRDFNEPFSISRSQRIPWVKREHNEEDQFLSRPFEFLYTAGTAQDWVSSQNWNLIDTNHWFRVSDDGFETSTSFAFSDLTITSSNSLGNLKYRYVKDNQTSIIHDDLVKRWDQFESEFGISPCDLSFNITKTELIDTLLYREAKILRPEFVLMDFSKKREESDLRDVDIEVLMYQEDDEEEEEMERKAARDFGLVSSNSFLTSGSLNNLVVNERIETIAV
jgi:hypothetical protein